jgi:hypothetical protein
MFGVIVFTVTKVIVQDHVVDGLAHVHGFGRPASAVEHKHELFHVEGGLRLHVLSILLQHGTDQTIHFMLCFVIILS